MVFITAGADVYATNDDDITPSMIALEYGREDEWIEALELCGYEPEEVFTSCIHHPTQGPQTSKLSFQEYCQQRHQWQHPSYSERFQSGDIDNDLGSCDENAYGEDDCEGISITTGDTDCVCSDCGDMEMRSVEEYADNGINDIGLDDRGERCTNNTEEMANHQSLGLGNMVDNDTQGMDVNFDDWLDNGMDFMQSFVDSDMILDTTFNRRI